MKKSVLICLAICIILLFVGCTKTVESDAEMLQVVIDELAVSKDVESQLIGLAEAEDAVLACVMTGNGNQAHGYYAAEFKKEQSGYSFSSINDLYDRGLDMRSYPWRDGYVFVSANEKCKKLSIEFPDGKSELIEIDTLPFMYHLKNVEDGFEYFFLDEAGNPLSY